jgi:hypothetical protein
MEGQWGLMETKHSTSVFYPCLQFVPDSRACPELEYLLCKFVFPGLMYSAVATLHSLSPSCLISASSFPHPSCRWKMEPGPSSFNVWLSWKLVLNNLRRDVLVKQRPVTCLPSPRWSGHISPPPLALCKWRLEAPGGVPYINPTTFYVRVKIPSTLVCLYVKMYAEWSMFVFLQDIYTILFSDVNILILKIKTCVLKCLVLVIDILYYSESFSLTKKPIYHINISYV